MLFRTCGTLDGHLDKLPLTWPYLSLLGFIVSLPRVAPDMTRRQFAIVSSSGYGNHRQVIPLFVSPIHKL
jgi:hypothetical protein